MSDRWSRSLPTACFTAEIVRDHAATVVDDEDDVHIVCPWLSALINTDPSQLSSIMLQVSGWGRISRTQTLCPNSQRLDCRAYRLRIWIELPAGPVVAEFDRQRFRLRRSARRSCRLDRCRSPAGAQGRYSRGTSPRCRPPVPATTAIRAISGHGSSVYAIAVVVQPVADLFTSGQLPPSQRGRGFVVTGAGPDTGPALTQVPATQLVAAGTTFAEPSGSAAHGSFVSEPSRSSTARRRKSPAECCPHSRFNRSSSSSGEFW
jgi:hypothetical protein